DLLLSILEDSDKPNPLQRRARSWSFYRRRYNYSSERVNSQQQQDSGDVPMDFQTRYAPYAVPSRRQRSSFQKQEQMHINMETKQKPSERRMERDRQNETLGSWFKIIIPFGIKYDEKWLLDLIQKECSVPFIPVEFHYEKMQAQFFVENANIAGALKNVNGKIFNEDNEKISIFVEPCDAPKSVQKALKSEKVEQMKLTINKPYDVHQQSLDIQRLLFGPGMAVAVTVGQVRVKSAGEMDKGQQLEPEGMWVDRNATCTTSPDKSTNIRSLSALPLHPYVSLISPLLPPLHVCLHPPPSLLSPTSLTSLSQLSSLFPLRYYLIHDYGDRQGLLCAYHEEACFSLTIPFHFKDPGPSSMCAYFKNSRNMKKLKDPGECVVGRLGRKGQ
uniref:Uncharacterized protein n=2 Tax=Bos TaxID=9903 RepID=A0A4W2FXE2_BOBOX